MSEEFDSDGLILTLAGIVVGVIVIYGFITVIKKAFKPAMTQKLPDSSQMIHDQHQHAEDINRKQDQMMRDLKQRMRDQKH